MNVLVIGQGGREHALAWVLARHGHRVLCAPGNPGSARVAETVAVSVDDLAGQVALAIERRVDLAVVGPEAPLVAGLADRLRARGIACFGPGQAGARLEGSKIFAKEFFARHRLATAEFCVCDSPADVDAALARLGDEVVVKADGLAAGKGVVVCAGGDQARRAAKEMMRDRKFGDAGARVIVEKRLAGREASILALVDGQRFALLPAAEDHKQVFDGDRGPNTGGMGVVTPTPVVTARVLERARAEVFAPALAGLIAEGIEYRGVLYAGLMVAPDGTPNLLEFNCRFGDPETEPLLARLDEDLLPWLWGAARAELPAGEPNVRTDAAVCVVMAAAGYPSGPTRPARIEGVPAAEALADVLVFHAGTREKNGELVSAGGRVLAVTGLGANVEAARQRAYAAVDTIHFDGAHFRRDIGLRQGA